MAAHSSLLPGKFHGQSSMAGYSPWGRKESDVTFRRCAPRLPSERVTCGPSMDTDFALTFSSQHWRDAGERAWHKAVTTKGEIKQESVSLLLFSLIQDVYQSNT